MKNAIILLGISLLINSCNNQPKNEDRNNNTEKTVLDKFSWLAGTWSNITPDAQLYEIWKKDNDSTFSGTSFMIVNNDTTFLERIKLESHGEAIYYIPTVSDQNNNQPVTFKLVSEINGDFIFENTEHDFPQRIIYNNSGPDLFNARVEGEDEGKFRKEEFIMKREKDGVGN